ncbi:MAG: flavodoxin [Spirochaetaceae bacterium]|nr:MAG: flavodoxin [Spirochaetaceae bacterium]
MKTLIAYATKYGATEKAARALSDQLHGDVELRNLTQDTVHDLAGYDRIIVGGSIYVGQIQDDVKTFCRDNQSVLLQKPLGLFICCGDEERADEQLAQNFDAALVEHASPTGYFGYEYDFGKMNILFRFIIQAKAKVRQSQYKLRDDNISAFAATLNSPVA